MKEKELKKNNKTLKIICIILLIIIILLVGVIGFTLGRNVPREAKSNYVNKTSAKEEEIKDIDNLTELSTETDLLLAISNSSEYVVSTIYGGYRFRYNLLKEELTAKQKQEIVLDHVEWDKITGDKWKSYDKMKNYVEQYDTDGNDWFLKDSKQASASKVNKLSIDLFGEKISKPIEETGACPVYLYDSKEQIYYRPSPQCGGTTATQIHSYKSKFVQTGNEAHVYVSLAFQNQGLSYDDVKIYKDFSIKNNEAGYEEITYESEYISAQRDQNFTITEDNYKDFSEYKFIFEQASNGNYYFIKTEQTK